MPSVVPSYEHQLFRRAGIKKSGSLLAYLLHPRRRFGAQRVDTTMNGSVTVAIKLGFGVNHRFRFLRAGGAIEINQWLAVNLAAQHREIGAQPVLLKMSCIPSRQALANARQHLLFQRVIANGFSKLGGEGVEDHLLRRLLIDTARAQIEQLLVVNTTDGGTVAAFDVVGVNFQLRFGIDFRQPSQAADCCWSSDHRFSARVARR